jgi:ribosome-associated protein
MKIPISEFDFSFSRSSGAGGQNVNKVNTKVTLSWDIENSRNISGAVRERFKKKFARYIVSTGEVKITSQRFRNQSRNIVDCSEKLHEMLDSVAKPVKKRLKTKPTKGSVKRRIEGKKNKSEIKKNRQKIKF